ncbi:MAG: hypothetical protein C4290_12420 [Chloroflexota bacterium]
MSVAAAFVQRHGPITLRLAAALTALTLLAGCARADRPRLGRSCCLRPLLSCVWMYSKCGMVC